jgi:hypothetical protein
MFMEITPSASSGTSAKRSRAKPKVVVKTAAAAATVAANKPRAPRKTLTTKAAAPAPVAAEPVPAAAVAEVVVEPGSEPPGDMVATAAYYLAAARNFMPGHELDDWLEAERNVRARLYG